jgi:ElaB/YqjD/DUF883 family membrane-anchored ribosome-binding protein
VSARSAGEDRFTFKENPMSNVAGAQAQARKAAFERRESSDVQDIRDNIQDLGNSVGDMATQQYARAHDTVSEALHETGSAIQRNPLAAIGIGIGVGLLFGLVTGGRSKPNPVTSGA